jgi:hypothetical protein
LNRIPRNIRFVNHQLSEQRIRSTCRELIAKHGGISGRRLRSELRQRYGAVGKTERVFAIWREETAAPAVRAEHAELKARLAAAHAAAAE